MPTGKKTAKRNFKIDGQKKVVNAAFELFATKGYSQTSVDSIAAKAKISKGLIYYYFKSKDEILKAIFSTLMIETEMMYGKADALFPKKFLKKMIENSFRFITEHTKLFRLILSLTAQPEVVKGLKNEVETFRKQWMNELTKVFKALKYPHPEMEVYQLIALFDGIGLAYISMKNYPIQKMQHFIEKKYSL